MTCNRYHLWAALDVHAFSKAEAVLRFSAEEDGMWVQWQDYARLKAEVERLRKAGDAMADEYRRMCKGEPAAGWFHRLMAGNEDFKIEHLDAWNAAKEGKPSV